MFAFRKYTVNSILLTTVMVYKVMANTESVSAELLLRGGKVGLGSCAIVLCRFVCQHPGERSHQYEKHAFPHKPFLVDHSHVFVKPPAAFRSAGLTLPRKVMASSMLSRSTYGWKDNCRASPCKFVLHLLKKKSVKHFHHILFSETLVSHLEECNRPLVGLCFCPHPLPHSMSLSVARKILLKCQAEQASPLSESPNAFPFH